MNLPTIFLFMLGLVFVGCGKSKTAPASSNEKTSATEAGVANETRSEQAAALRPPASPNAKKAAAKPTQRADDALIGAVHPFMTSQLRIFIQQKGRLPESFSEFANARMDSVPRPPEGLRWAVDEHTQEVKLVRQ